MKEDPATETRTEGIEDGGREEEGKNVGTGSGTGGVPGRDSHDDDASSEEMPRERAGGKKAEDGN
jgi:hypothetical protein